MTGWLALGQTCHVSGWSEKTRQGHARFPSYCLHRDEVQFTYRGKEMSGVVSLDTSDSASTSDQSSEVFFVPATNGASGTENSCQHLQDSVPGQVGGCSSTESIGGGNSVVLSASDILQSLSLLQNNQGLSSQSQQASSSSHVSNTDTSSPHGGEGTMEITAKSIVILTPKGQGQINLADSQPAKELMVQGVPLNMQPIAATSVPCTTMATLPPGSIIIALPHEVENQNICNLVKLPVREKSILRKDKQKRSGRVVCEICNAGFMTRNTLIRHQQLHKADTEEDRRPACEVCGRRFTQLSDLKRHQHTHTGTEPYRCQLCGRGFLRRSDLNSHLRFHNKVKPFHCALCDKAYYQSGDLRRHIRKSHEQTKDIACPLCEKLCATERSLRTHFQSQHSRVLVSQQQHTRQLRASEGGGQTSVQQQEGETVPPVNSA